MCTVESFIEEAKKKTFYEVVLMCKERLITFTKSPSGLKDIKKDPRYRRFLEALLCVLENEDCESAAIPDEYFVLTKEVMEDFVQRGELNKTALKIYTK